MPISNQAHLDSMLWVPDGAVSAESVRRAKKLLTVQPPKDFMTDLESDPIYNWKERPGETGYPIDFGLRHFSTLSFWDNTTNGGRTIPVRRLPDPTHPNAAPGQSRFFDDVIHALTEYFTVLACAPTGSGKTVTVLNAIGQFKVPALVIVPSNVLAQQWKAEAVRHLGMLPEEIGAVGGGVENWRGKSLVTVVLHNLFMKEYSQEFYENFGFVVWDECHRLGAREFAKTMPLFHAKYKVAVSATPTRKDGCSNLVFNYFGGVRVESRQEGLPITCRVVNYHHNPWKVSWIDSCRSDVKGMQYLARLTERNRILSGLAVDCYDGPHTGVLLLTRFNEHVHTLVECLLELGVPAEDIGQFCGTHLDTETGEVRKSNMDYLNDVKQSRKIVVATYAMMKEGVDIPRISAGIEALPLADGIQAIGRARRPLPGKPDPVWFSIVDKGIRKFEGYGIARLRGYSKDKTIKVIR